MTTIKFKPLTKLGEIVEFPPVVATKFIPDWYKSHNIWIDDKNYDSVIHNDKNERVPNTTVKGCTPFLDALSCGYMFSLGSDIEVTFDKNNKSLRIDWMLDNENRNVVTEHTEQQFNVHDKNILSPVFKFSSNYLVETPPGYSCLFTHPFNRHDLPFRTFTGIVDTDKYPGAVQFPFQFLPMESGTFTIDFGTPICQILPFKRDSWKSEVEEFTQWEVTKSLYLLRRKISRSYKRQFWTRKEFR